MKILRDAVVPFFDDNHLLFILIGVPLTEKSVRRSRVSREMKWIKVTDSNSLKMDQNCNLTLDHFQIVRIRNFDPFSNCSTRDNKLLQTLFWIKNEFGKDDSPKSRGDYKNFKNGIPNQATSGACRTIQIHLNNVGKVDRKPLICVS